MAGEVQEALLVNPDGSINVSGLLATLSSLGVQIVNSNTGANVVNGAVVVNLPGVTGQDVSLADLFRLIYIELQVQTQFLKQGFGINDDEAIIRSDVSNGLPSAPFN